MKAVLCTPIGNTSFDMRIVDFTSATLLDQLQSFTGGYVSRHDITIPRDMIIPYSKYGVLDLWANEEGKLLSMYVNKLGTYLLQVGQRTSDFLVGTIVITGGITKAGCTRGLTSTKVDWLFEMAERIKNDSVFDTTAPRINTPEDIDVLRTARNMLQYPSPEDTNLEDT